MMMKRKKRNLPKRSARFDPTLFDLIWSSCCLFLKRPATTTKAKASTSKPAAKSAKPASKKASKPASKAKKAVEFSEEEDDD